MEKVTEMPPNYNCGGCGHAGCSGWQMRRYPAEMDTVLPPMQTERRQIADYLNSTPGPMGLAPREAVSE
ncbi:MAG: hypothetical protein ACLVJ6_03765 [Merdibacter sp.]